jgi:hypothetical protein
MMPCFVIHTYASYKLSLNFPDLEAVFDALLAEDPLEVTLLEALLVLLLLFLPSMFLESLLLLLPLEEEEEGGDMTHSKAWVANVRMLSVESKLLRSAPSTQANCDTHTQHRQKCENHVTIIIASSYNTHYHRSSSH